MNDGQCSDYSNLYTVTMASLFCMVQLDSGLIKGRFACVTLCCGKGSMLHVRVQALLYHVCT